MKFLQPSILASPSRRLFSSTAARDVTYGFIGLGRMGYPMARNLRQKLPKEDTLVVYDVNKAATKQFVEELGEGVEVAGDGVVEIANKSDTIITMLPEPSHVNEVFSTILQLPKFLASPRQKLFIDCSTIDVATSVSLGGLVHRGGGIFLDAPVSGGVVGASAGTLTFMLGSPPELVPRVEPVLSMMGRRILHCGKPGSGLAGKLSNNYLLAIQNIATSEAMNLGMKLGLDKNVLKDLINVSTGKCWSTEVNNPIDNVEKDFQGGFGIGLMKKDLKLAVTAAEDAGAMLTLGKLANKVYEDVDKDEKCAGRDFSVVYRWLGGDEGKKKE
ncbi:hypothetical protein RUND412_001391 [Rhizina undulata]